MNLNDEKELRDKVYEYLLFNTLAQLQNQEMTLINLQTKFWHRIHKGERGVWRDATRTKKITNDKVGIAVSFHSVTEGPYNDSHGLETIKYAFPNTRSITHDVREIESMKVVENEMPLFIVVGPKGGDKILRRGLIRS